MKVSLDRRLGCYEVTIDDVKYTTCPCCDKPFQTLMAATSFVEHMAKLRETESPTDSTATP